MQNSFSYEWYRAKTRFDTEGKGNPKWPIGLFRKRRARLCLARA